MRNIYEYSHEPVTPAVYRKTYDEEGNETGEVLVSPASEEVVGLVVSQVETKTLDDIKRVIGLAKPVKVLDKFIALYLPTLDDEQNVADAWYEQYQITQTSDPDELGKEEPVLDEDGNLQYDESENLITAIGLNAYQKATQAMESLESTSAWLKSLKGDTEAPARPEYVIDVQKWKGDNSELLNTALKKHGTDILGSTISLNETNQNGLSAIKSAIELASKYNQNIFPIIFKADTNDGTTKVEFNDESSFDNFCLMFLHERQKFFN